MDDEIDGGSNKGDDECSGKQNFDCNGFIKTSGGRVNGSEGNEGSRCP